MNKQIIRKDLQLVRKERVKEIKFLVLVIMNISLTSVLSQKDSLFSLITKKKQETNKNSQLQDNTTLQMTFITTKKDSQLERKERQKEIQSQVQAIMNTNLTLVFSLKDL